MSSDDIRPALPDGWRLAQAREQQGPIEGQAAGSATPSLALAKKVPEALSLRRVDEVV